MIATLRPAENLCLANFHRSYRHDEQKRQRGYATYASRRPYLQTTILNGLATDWLDDFSSSFPLSILLVASKPTYLRPHTHHRVHHSSCIYLHSLNTPRQDLWHSTCSYSDYGNDPILRMLEGSRKSSSQVQAGSSSFASRSKFPRRACGHPQKDRFEERM
jgi:hypothetical protein